MPHLTLSVSSETISTKSAGAKITRGFTLQQFDLENLENPEKLKTVLSTRIHSTNVWQDGTICSHHGNQRISLNIGVTGLMLDFDGGTTLDELTTRFDGYIYVLYSSTGHSEELPKYHLLLPFDPAQIPAFPNEADALYAWCKDQQARDGLYHGADRCFDKARKFYPHCAAEATTEMILCINTEDSIYIPYPEIKSYTERAVCEADIDPDEYKRQRTHLIKNLWERTDVERRTQRAFQLALDCKRSGLPYAEAKAKLLSWIEAQEKSRSSPYGKNGVSAEERLEQQVLQGAYHNTHQYQLPPNRESPPPWPTNAPSPLPEEIAVQTPPEILARFFNNKPVIIEDRAMTWTEMSDKPELTEAPKSLIKPYYIALRGRVVLLWGTDKHGKGTIITMSLKYLIQKTNHCVLLVNADEPDRDLAHRMTKAGVPKSDNIIILSNPLSLREVAYSISKYKPDIIVFDALNTYLGHIGIGPPDNGDDEGWSRVMTDFSVFAESYNAAVIVIHHANKDIKNRSPRGNGMIPAGVSMKVQIETKKHLKRTTLWYDGRVTHEPTHLKYVGDYTYEEISNGTNDKDVPTTSLPISENAQKVIKLLISGKRIPRTVITEKTGIARSTLTDIKGSLNIKSKKVGKTENWRLTPKQIKEYNDMGIHVNSNDLTGSEDDNEQ